MAAVEEHETASPQSVTLSFVYGTLKRGFPNYPQIPENAVYVGTARTLNAFPLVVSTQFSVPFMLYRPDHEKAFSVKGELFLLDEQSKSAIDKFEGVDTGFYYTKAIPVIIMDISEGYGGHLHANEIVQADVYFRDPSNTGPLWAHEWTINRLLELPMIEEYTQEHALHYLVRASRNDRAKE
ncbi:Gamma-glutamylaminecyclotransferase [Gracilariopsis chorda]|uniref:Gamma-glutamylcyclotransferase family protein n=1 Tax=Gracilariopsis chorda TaxID=448386 RepID=A0A2V3J2T6_9FLOR|nr:Gamma-glutamylaminecyclotransferase [Gracilariopsis chorda]|eukprot:PXF48695.1 Gamma-glutamylaminecyclotransferase [Gracilariopsis chorda]